MKIINRIINRFWWIMTQNKIRQWSKNSKRSKINGYIVMYHYISDEHVPNMSESCQCTGSEFKRSINYFKNNGYTFISLDKALEIIHNELEQKFVVITFDDIPDCVYTNAYPILKQLNIPFTVYVTYNFIDKESFITKEHLLKLKSDPLCTIGAHTMNHPMLRHCKNSFYEIQQCKIALEGLTGCNVEHFAYPYGQLAVVSKSNINMVKTVGYKTGVSAIGAPLTSESTKNLFFLPRIIINGISY